MENVRELISVSQKYDGLEPGVSLATFLEEVALVSDTDDLNFKDNYVTLMTLHSAKGLEFPVVFIMGMEEGIFPHSRSMLDPQQLEEERRLAYVGMTRAMKKLHLTYAKNRVLYGEYQTNAPSQFLMDLPDDLIDADAFNEEGEKGLIHQLKKSLDKQEHVTHGADERVKKKFRDGDKVKHDTFGEGMIVSLQGDIATVAFKDPKIGIKKLARVRSENGDPPGADQVP
jgi:DNA helicase-2/ATP-dependent DNA helicase PcrA